MKHFKTLEQRNISKLEFRLQTLDKKIDLFKEDITGGNKWRSTVVVSVINGKFLFNDENDLFEHMNKNSVALCTVYGNTTYYVKHDTLPVMINVGYSNLPKGVHGTKVRWNKWFIKNNCQLPTTEAIINAYFVK